MPKEKPILFSAPMIRAILGGEKTQTRRVVKPQFGRLWGQGVKRGDDRYSIHVDIAEPDGSWKWLNCPYGMAGHRLWVKETWRTGASLDNDSPGRIAEKSLDANYRNPWAPLKYDADGDACNGDTVADFGGWSLRTRSPIHMPRWASRITLEITGVKVERLQDISEEDARAEGIPGKAGAYIAPGVLMTSSAGVQAVDWPCHKTAREAFETLWCKINGPDSWAANPWVWAISFRRVDKE